MNTAPFSCFGVPIEGTSLQDTIIRINEGRARWIVTVNPEILLEAKRDATYRDILRQADLRVADGFGVTCAAFVNGQHITRVTGVELAEKLLDEAVIHNWNVAFIGGEPGVAEKALATQQTQRPTLRGFALQGGKIGADGMGDDTDAEAIHQITMQAPDVVLVAFGHPKQERWIAKNLPTLPSVKVILGIGGTFDYWAGIVPRAPKWLQTIGLEWLYRLFREPWRWKRIWRAVVVFPLSVLVYRG